MTNDRSSEADDPLLVTDAQEIARIEAENTLRQFDGAMSELRKWIGNPRYKLRPSTILRLNRIALERLSKYAGVFRPGDIKITGSGHLPISSDQVPDLVEEFCDYIEKNWDGKSAIHLSAYALWRLNWIHPFVDGNGRTARIVSYLILCARLGYRLPGTKTIPEQIAANKQPYYLALEAADAAQVRGTVDVSELEAMMDAHLAAQLVDVHNHAAGAFEKERAAIAQYPQSDIEVIKPSNSVAKIVSDGVGHVERHPVVYGFFGLLIVTVLGALLTH
ncbi:Fic family protein [Mesorhizobium sp. LNHC221B00]|uniref:Fic family protein n=1 Tax=Mesorhizobium sp. LNHC221B00 TaxID=1287233 RepID=UPI000A0168DF|nr:Fic family protein [Mesorhizobium sp. LNHC221B00]